MSDLVARWFEPVRVWAIAEVRAVPVRGELVMILREEQGLFEDEEEARRAALELLEASQP